MDKEALFKARLPEEIVEIPNVGTVLVRGLSRADIHKMRKADTSEPGSFERLLLAKAMVDPELTEDEVDRWQEAATSGEVDDVVAVITRLSALDKESAKEKYKEFESDPDAEFRLRPGGAAGDDGVPDEGGAE